MKRGDRVALTGSPHRRGEILELSRRYGQEGAVVWFDYRGDPGDGVAPRWVPLSRLTPIDEKPSIG